MSHIIRAGLIGCGGISRLHLEAVQTLSDVKFVAFCDIDLARAQHHAEQNGGGDVYTAYHDLLSREDLDVVHIATPHYLHTEMSLAALKAGLYVLCEKPMAITMEDARTLLQADTQKKLGVVFQNRFNESTVIAKRMLDGGELGAFRTARATVAWSRDAAYYAQADWRAKWATAGGGTLINQSIHTVDLLHYLCGAFSRIKGSITTDLLQDVIEVEENSHAVIQFAGGQTGLIHTSNSFGLTELPEILIYCEKGHLLLQGESLILIQDGQRTVLHDQTTQETTGKACYGNGHTKQITAFYENVQNNAPISLGAQQAFPATWAVLGIYESSRTNQWVPYSLC